MFKKKTVFILGAGASWHYGYPTGEELVKAADKTANIIDTFYKNKIPPEKLKYYIPTHYEGIFGNLLDGIRNIKKSISQATPLVIDDFLGRNKDIADIGKMLIAMVLLECEKRAQIRSGKKDGETKEDTGEGDWIRYIIQQLIVDCEKPEDLLANQVTFVTFNYDLSLEMHLHQALSNYQWFAEGGHSKQFFDPGRIYHVYGQLRDFDPENPDEPQKSSTDKYYLASEIDRAWDASLAIGKDGRPRLRTIAPDEKTIDPEIPKAIADAEYLYFLGYGFDRRNNELLGLGQRPAGSPRQHVYFTNYGNQNKISKNVERVFHLINSDAVSGSPYGDLLGDHYIKRSHPSISMQYYCEKSIKSVYDALAQDFDWPD